MILDHCHKIQKAAMLLGVFSLALSGCAVSESAEASASPAAESVSPAGLFTVSYLDVGQGDSALVQCDGKYMLIDGGEPDQSQKIYTILQNRGITNLEYIVCTHTHSDHAGGLAGALQTASCAQALVNTTQASSATYQKFLQQLTKHNVPYEVPAVGDTFSLGSASFVILGPTDINDTMDENDKSLVLRMDYQNTSFLFTGDAEQEEQQLLLFNSYDALHVNVLKASHHGSANGATRAWLKAVQPQITVISCGRDNPYGHPQGQTLDLLSEIGSAIYRTDLQGEITVNSDGTNVTASVSRNPDVDVNVPGVLPATASSSSSVSAEDSYILNTNAMKFHRPDCKEAAKISAKNRKEYTGDRQSLIDQGYAPCQVCKP